MGGGGGVRRGEEGDVHARVQICPRDIAYKL